MKDFNSYELFDTGRSLVPSARGDFVPRAFPSERSPGTVARPAQRPGRLLALIDQKGFRQHFQPDSTILLHGDPADAIYLVESGTARCGTIDSQGARQIFAFPRKGAIIGISDMDRWHFTAEAVDHVILKSVPRQLLEQHLAVDADLRNEVRACMRTLLLDRERQLLTMVSTKGPERLLRFLEDFAGPRAARGYVALPMSRRDIADHIGLSTESVSRGFSQLKRQGFIDLKSSGKYRLLRSPTSTEAGQDSATRGCVA